MAKETLSNAQYAEEVLFQEESMGSVIISQVKNKIPSSIPMIEPSPEPNPKETGESSLIFCEICVERKEIDQMFKIDSCAHSFCCECMSKHVAAKIQDSTCTIITCPGMNCRAILELDICRSQLSKGVIDIWEEMLCKEMISEWEKFYCPFKDCSALLVNDSDCEGGEAIRESECPFCHRLFCAQCYVPWHSGVECEEFQRLNEDERGREDLMVMELARAQKWSRCPHCKFYVERTEGCPHITCRCKFEFCYGCGSQWTASHSGCQRN
ncbi:probable E3 ubiquitin-protein ligase RNF144A-A isoform X2 [Jatropha curcas]|uniref:probable E3 ubiquitin-protein ligase RNF144A-A isoform X2 n=1 Tax=Jatropha curcas TaxID=180498 RepID=UPI0018959E5D|nr:probable E3 ubiquitin-protein ligase RNF144A-A [Jatropha curcas]XP_037491108.1 probable E3 ubiquitin-protein ligase RNF144A-A isoform X2 [Jatropha curcas]